MSSKIIIAIDGHSACGKSTLANDLAHSLNYLYVDSGSMYRATTYYFILNKVDVNNMMAVENALLQMPLDLRIISEDESGLFMANEYLSKQLRTTAINSKVSEISSIRLVRKKMVEIQQKIGIKKGIVMDGRDIGSVVFPQAELKIFLTASLAVRIQRRYDEAQLKGFGMTKAEVEQNLKHRDHIDSTRSESPLIQTTDAVVIDNTNLSREEQLAMILALARLRMK